VGVGGRGDKSIWRYRVRRGSVEIKRERMKEGKVGGAIQDN